MLSSVGAYAEVRYSIKVIKLVLYRMVGSDRRESLQRVDK